MVVFDTSSVIGGLLQAVTYNVTGDLFLTLLLVVAIFQAIGIGLRIPTEISMALVLPFILVALTLTSSLLPVLGIIAVILAVLFAKYLFFA